MSRESRVTVDIDGYHSDWKLRAVRAWNALRRHADEVGVRVSSSGEGVHIIGWFDNRLSQDQKMRLRRHLSDDSNRIWMDRQRQRYGHVQQVLWSSKSESGSADGDFETVWDALDHIEVTTPTPDL
jgi:hypothetical protein